jgi:hypothetical protein
MYFQIRKEKMANLFTKDEDLMRSAPFILIKYGSLNSIMSKEYKKIIP